MANLISLIRIICSLALLFCEALSAPFYALYAAAGLSDALDGFVARKTGTASQFGARLDTAADFILVAVSLVKLIPVLKISTWLYICIAVIAAIKLVNIASGLIKNKKLPSEHTKANKLTGALLFALPLTAELAAFDYCAGLVCLAALYAAIEEGHLIRTGKSVM